MIDAAAFVGALAGFAPMLEWTERESTEDKAGLQPHLHRFHAASGGPWPASCSLWGQIYFNTLLIPATCLLACGWPADAHARRLRATFNPETGAPLRFALCGERLGENTGEARLVSLLDRHIAQVIDDLADEGGLSRRMLWEGVEGAIRWTVAEIASSQPDRLPQLAALTLASPCRFATACALKCGAARPRKFCCLRYQLPGQNPCPGICPRA